MQIPTSEYTHIGPLLTSISAIPSSLGDEIYLSTPIYTTTRPSNLAQQAAVWLASAYGYNSLAFLALDRRKQLFFCSTGKAFISYVLQGNVALVIGDPIGPTQELSLVLAEFLAFWRARHKSVAFWLVREELLNMYRTQKLHALKIGEDPIIDVQHFTLKGGKMANVRSSAKRAEKDHMRVLFYEGKVTSVAYQEQMAAVSRAWLARKHGSEMGFSMGRFGADADARQLTALAIDQDEKVHAFLTFHPIYGRKGWCLDLLRRSEQATPGTMELLLVRSLEHFKARGDTMVSLGLAPQSNNNQSEVSFLGTCCSRLLRLSNRFRHFQTLTSFKQKFQPTWENRYLIFSHYTHLLQIGIALDAAHHQ